MAQDAAFNEYGLKVVTMQRYCWPPYERNKNGRKVRPKSKPFSKVVHGVSFYCPTDEEFPGKCNTPTEYDLLQGRPWEPDYWAPTQFGGGGWGE